MTANSEKMEIEIGSIANMFWYIMNYQYANFGTFITNWAFLSQICWTNLGLRNLVNFLKMVINTLDYRLEYSDILFEY